MSYMPHISVQQQPLASYGAVPVPSYAYGSQGLYNAFSGGYPLSGLRSPRGQPQLEPFHASQITPSLYLGSYDDAQNIQELQRLGITHVLNVADDCPIPEGPYRTANIHGMHLRIEDCDDVEIAPFVAQGVPYMHQTMSAGSKLLVHCRYGKSRSAMMVLSYLMQHGVDGRAMGYIEATNYVRCRRPEVDPNPGFVAQLQMMDAGSRCRSPLSRRSSAMSLSRCSSAHSMGMAPYTAAVPQQYTAATGYGY